MSIYFKIGNLLLLLILVVAAVEYKDEEKVYAQEPSFACMGGVNCVPSMSPTPVISSSYPSPTAYNGGQPSPTQAGAGMPSTTPGCEPAGVSAVTDASTVTQHARKRGGDGSEGLFKKIIELLKQLIELLKNILGSGGINTPSGTNPANPGTPTGGQENNQGQGPTGQQAPQGQEQAGKLPPCPTNTPAANQPGGGQPTTAQQPTTTQPTTTQPTSAPGNAAPTAAGGGAGSPAPTGGGNVVQSEQCSDTEPPPGAKEAGLTKLAFCDDFSDPSRIDFDNNPVAGKTTFAAMRPGNIFGAQTEVRSDFTFTPQGTLISKSRHDNYQADFISTWPTGGGHQGFDTGAKPFYAEISVKHNLWNSQGARGFFAFWAMDTCHLYNTGCSQFYEPDFYEFISTMHVNAFHWWSSSMSKVDSSCITTSSAGITTAGKDTQFNTYGALFTNEGTNYYHNDKANITGACSNKTWSKTIPQGPQPGKTGRYPIIFGSGPNQPYEADFVRVWQAP